MDADAPEEAQEVIIRFQGASGEAFGPEASLSAKTTLPELHELLLAFKKEFKSEAFDDADEDGSSRYAFRLQLGDGAPGAPGAPPSLVDVESTLADAIAKLGDHFSQERSLTVRFYPLATFRVRPVTRCTASLQGHSEAVLCAAFSPDGTRLATGSGDTTVRLWDLDTEMPLKTLQGHRNWVLSVVWSPTNDAFASCGMDKVVIVWSSGAGAAGVEASRAGTFLRGHTKPVTCLAWQPLHLTEDGGRNLPLLASASQDCTVRIWDPVKAVTLITLGGHTKAVTQVIFSGVQDRLYTASRDTTVKVWDWARGTVEADLRGHAHWVNTMAVNSEAVMASGCFDHRGDRAQSCAGGGEDEGVNSAAVASAADVSAPAGGDRGAGQKSAKWLHAARIAARARFEDFLAKCCGGEERLVTGSDDSTLFLWNPELGGNRAKSPAKSPVAPAAKSGSSPAPAVHASVQTKALARLTGHQNTVSHVRFSPDGRFIASASFDKSVRLWDAATGRMLKALRGHVGPVYRLAWAPDSNYLASASADSTVKIWSTRQAKLAEDLAGHGDEVYALDWAVNGARVASGSKDRYVKVWRH